MAQAIANTEWDVRLGAEAVIRYRNQAIRVNHHVVGEERGQEVYDLTFTVSNGIAPRSFDKLSDACEYLDNFVDSRNRFTTPDYVKPVRAH